MVLGAAAGGPCSRPGRHPGTPGRRRPGARSRRRGAGRRSLGPWEATNPCQGRAARRAGHLGHGQGSSPPAPRGASGEGQGATGWSRRAWRLSVSQVSCLHCLHSCLHYCFPSPPTLLEPVEAVEAKKEGEQQGGVRLQHFGSLHCLHCLHYCVQTAGAQRFRGVEAAEILPPLGPRASTPPRPRAGQRLDHRANKPHHAPAPRAQGRRDESAGAPRLRGTNDARLHP